MSAVTSIALPGGVRVAFAPVPGGCFAMGSGSGRDDERPVHAVSVSGFLMGVTPVTRAQYAPFVAGAGAQPPPWWTHPAFACDDQPVVGVSWHEAHAYAEWLAALAGRPVRLPSEAEWERAARGGLEGAATPWGARLPEGEVPDGPLDGPWLVGRGRANGFGLLDIGTIVHEWCADWYGPYAAVGGVSHDPRGPAEGARRASRGGSWRHKQRWSPPSARSSLPPEMQYADYGLRLAMDAPSR